MTRRAVMQEGIRWAGKKGQGRGCRTLRAVDERGAKDIRQGVDYVIRRFLPQALPSPISFFRQSPLAAFHIRMYNVRAGGAYNDFNDVDGEDFSFCAG